MNKKTLGIICGLGGFIAALLVVVIVLLAMNLTKNDNKSNNDNSGDTSITQTTTAITSTSNNNQASDNQNNKANNSNSELEFVVETKSSWEGEGKFFYSYELSFTNKSEKKIKEWSINMPVPEGTKVSSNWNCNIDISSNNWKIKSVEYNKEIEKHTNCMGLGMIIEYPSKPQGDASNFKLEAIFDDGSKSEVSGGSNGNSNGNNTNQTNNTTVASSTNTAAKGSATIPTGRLSVSGTNVVDASGNVVQLRGVSTHGLAWFPDYVNYEAFKTLRDDWKANTVRLAMYTAESGGYCTGGDKDKLKKLIDDGVKYAADLGMYCIIDWHILSDGNPNTNKAEAIEFFKEMSSKYANYENVIYEICNEPQNSNWGSVIKPYAEEIVSTIRANDSKAIIIVGTNTWSQDVDEVIGNTLSDNNVLYTLHFYAATHKDGIQSKLNKALDAGVPVIVSECSICDASGNGGIDYDSANTWKNLLNSKNVGFIAWSLCNKNESSALIKSTCIKTSGWTEEDLSDTGKWFRQAIRGE